MLKRTEVAVGVVLRADGAVLIAQRTVGKPYGGWWEFPGGKFEPGEDAAAALARELDEELGIRVRTSVPWVVREHVYPHAHVRLHFRRVVAWDGEVVSREGQAFVWRRADAIDVGPLLPAAIAPIGWLRLPPFYAISDAAERGIDAFVARLDERLADRADARALRLVQLREPTLDARSFARLFEAVVARCAAAGTRVLVSSRHPRRYWVAAAERTGGGVHLTGRDLAAAATVLGDRGVLRLVAASCHDADDLERAGAAGVDLVVVGPVARTRSHPDTPTLGWQGLAAAIARTPVPVYALGGLGAGDLDAAWSAGAHGVAAQRAAWRDGADLTPAPVAPPAA